MAKIDSNFPHDIFKFLHRPLREIDKAQGKEFLERLLLGPQSIFENAQAKIDTLIELIDPAKTRADLLQFLKDHVGFTVELNNITNGLATNDLRKLISLAVALWNQKGTEQGYENIVRLFTGKSIRIFNYFDFRLIVGEKAFGEEQLGEDAWLISLPGFDATSDASNNVVDLLTFESNFKDRSNTRNDGTVHGVSSFFNTPASGFPALSDKYLNLNEGVVTQPNSVAYDFSADFTIELFIRTSISQAGKFLFFKKDGAGKGIEIVFDSTANQVSFDLDDGAINISGSITPAANLDDGTVRHIALVIDRANGARLYINGTESTGLIALGALSDLTNSAQIIVGGDGVVSNNYLGDLDNFRISLNDVYDVTTGTLTPPLSGFIEFREEELDEFFSDIRIPVEDPANFDKILMLRILNLMRPSSERLRAIFITIFDEFVLGGGKFETLQGTKTINSEFEMVLDPDTIVQTDIFEDTEFQDIVLQIKATLEDDGSIPIIAGYQNERSLIFDGSNDNVTIPNVSAQNPTTNITVAAWVQGPPQDNAIMAHYNTTGDKRKWLLGSGLGINTDKLRVFISKDGSTSITSIKQYFSSTVVLDNTWHHVAFTFSNNTLKLYVDGVLETPIIAFDAVVNTLFSSTVDPILIGDNFNNQFAHIGNIDNAAIFDITLSDSEIAEIFNLGKPANLLLHSKVANLVGGWRLGDDPGDIFPTIIDITGNSNGTMTNMTASDIVVDALPAVPTGVYENEFSVFFDGVNDFANVSPDASLGSGITKKLTVSCWIKGLPHPSATAQIIGQFDSVPDPKWLMASGVLSDKLTVSLSNLGTINTKTYISSSVILDDIWHHIAFVYDGDLANTNQLELYIDGVKDTGVVKSIDNDTPILFNSPTVVQLAKLTPIGPTFHSFFMDNPSVWNVAFTSIEITEIYNGGVPFDLNLHSKSANGVSWWKMDGDTHPIILDQFGSNNLTMFNMSQANFSVNALPAAAPVPSPGGGKGSFLFFLQDINNFYEFRANVATKKLSLHKTVAGVSSQIGSDIDVDIVEDVSYIFTITTDFNAGGPDTLLQTFFDSNRVHQVVDVTFEKGKFGMKTDGSTTMKVDEVEMFQRPLDVRLIEPGFDL